MVEAQFAELPVITNNCTSMQTNTSYGIAVDPERTTYVLNGYRSWSVPSTEGIASALENLYNKDETKYSLKKINKDLYDIDYVIHDWLDFLNIQP